MRMLALLAIPAGVVAAASGLPSAAQIDMLRRWLLAHPEIITSPDASGSTRFS